jgi:predicted DNA repair protein MutK
VAVLVAIALAMTVGVYGLVAAIVKLDDLGLWLNQRGSALARGLGAGILRTAPWLMKALSVAGTAAMFLVGGGILVHGVAPLYQAISGFTQALGASWGAWGPVLLSTLAEGGIGVVAGALVLGAVMLVQRLRGSPVPA